MTGGEKVYFIRFTVSGRGAFPTDMLRYDHCWAATEADSGEIARSLHSGLDVRTVTLRGFTFEKLTPALTFRLMHGELPKSGVTPGRWQSFGWRVENLQAD